MPEARPRSPGKQSEGREATKEGLKFLAPALAAWLGVSPAVGADRIPVLGGTESISRLLGQVDTSPENFVASLNRVLLNTLHPGEQWEKDADRQLLVQYLADLEALRGRFSSRIDIGLEPKTARKRFRALSEFLGYDIKIRKSGIVAVPKEGDQAVRRQRLAVVLGWDVPRLAAALADGSAVTLLVAEDQVQVPHSLRLWGAAVGGPIEPAEALRELATSQRLGFILEGLRRVSAETATVLSSLGWEWLSREAAPQLYRYSVSIRVVDGAVRLPGGPPAAPLWAQIIGERPEDTGPFLRQLLTRKNGKAAFLWHALSFVPPPVVDFYLGGAASRRPERKFVKELFQRLDETVRVDFSLARGGDLGFGTFVRSVPLSEESDEFALAGGPGLWFVAIRDEESPADAKRLGRLVAKGREKRLSEEEFLLKTLKEQVKVRGVEQPVLPRLIRTSRMFESSEKLRTPENVMLLARASDIYPAVLRVLDELDLEDPRTIRSYLLSVAHLDALPAGPSAELLILNFQGGVEWLRLLGRAGKVPAEALEDHLQRWANIHLRHADPHAAAPDQHAWITSLLDTLPAARGGAGRDSNEAAFIEALNGRSDPQRFEWGGLAYSGFRASGLDAAMAEHLGRQQIPAAGDVHALHLGIRGLEQSAAKGDVEAARKVAGELRRQLRKLPSPAFESALEEKDLRARLLPIDRPRVETILTRIEKQRKPKRLARMAGEVSEAAGLMAREIRPLLLAPAYLGAMGEASIVLFEDPHLVRKHLLPVGTPWQRAGIDRVDGSNLGAHVQGHLSTLAEAIADYGLVGSGGGGSKPARDRIFYRDFVDTRWHLLTPETSRVVSALVAAGREVLQSGLSELPAGGGPHLDLLAQRVPFARLERSAAGDGRSVVSISELLITGLAALTGDVFAPAGLPRLAMPIRVEFEDARDAVGSDWRERLAQAGGATPHLNGRSSPWLGPWPPYELVDTERYMTALFERQMLDLKLVVIDYLGRHSLPGVVGEDLMSRLLPQIVSRPLLEGPRDWEGLLLWLDRIDDDLLDKELRECMRHGLYTVERF